MDRNIYSDDQAEREREYKQGVRWVWGIFAVSVLVATIMVVTSRF